MAQSGYKQVLFNLLSYSELFILMKPPSQIMTGANLNFTTFIN